MKKVFIVLFCDWDGDSNLIDSFIDVFLSKEEAVECCKKGIEDHNNIVDAHNSKEPIRKLRRMQEKIYEDIDLYKTNEFYDEGYGSPSFYLIKTKTF